MHALNHIHIFGSREIVWGIEAHKVIHHKGLGLQRLLNTHTHQRLTRLIGPLNLGSNGTRNIGRNRHIARHNVVTRRDGTRGRLTEILLL
jgi:hypothetical protein